MKQNPMQHLISQTIWLILISAATFTLWVSAASALPDAERNAQLIQATATVSADQVTAGQGNTGPAVSVPIATIDLTSFPTPSPEEIATREAMLNNTYRRGPSSPPASQEIPGPIPNTETSPNGDIGSTAQSMIEKAPLQSGLALAGSTAVLVMLARFLSALALLLRRQ